MRTLSILLLLWCCCAAACEDCEAGGFFRRVPEVGEWARYDVSWFVVHIASSTPAVYIAGDVTLKCVGEVEVEQVPYLWIEVCVNSTSPEGVNCSSVTKMRVPISEIVDGDLVNEQLYGWQGILGSDPSPLTYSATTHNEDETSSIRMSLFPGTQPEETREDDERLLEVDGIEVQLLYSESHPRVSRTYNDVIAGCEATYWPQDELTFGVAAADFHYTSRRVGSQRERVTNIRFDLVATGTDAVSELPDHN